MRVYSAAFLISMAFATPAMALSSGPIFDPRAPSICNIGQTKATAQSALPGNEIVRPGTRNQFARGRDQNRSSRPRMQG